MALEIAERDEAGNLVLEYLAEAQGTRVDVIYPKEAKSYAQRLLGVFLPAGYPQSVTEDYIHYQIYDSLQAFSSSIAGLLASRAVLEGVGVGDSTASPTSALLLSVLQESTGRIATILFAHRLGTALEPECKMFRLAADVFNDTAMVLDCLSPAFHKPIRVAVLSFSSCLRALCGVCAGSAKASLSAHFASKGNLGEVNAAGSLVVSHITSPFATWTTLLFLLAVHLATNYAAVKAVRMRSLNRQRANILFSSILQHGVVLSPNEVSKRERIFHRGDVLRWSDDEMLGHCKIGVSLQEMLGRMGEQNTQTGSLALHAIQISELLTVFTSEAYIACPAASAVDISIVLKAGCGPNDQLKAWAHALLLAKRARDGKGHSGNKPNTASAPPKDRLIAELRQTLEDVRVMFDKYGNEMMGKGWDLDVAAMETRAGTRLQIGVQQVG
ncbi:vitamin B6 photo-protection and homoeostasis-domain-containing protein [Alternaria alternata]|nr:vitamin B6 photo-protection and homoeostasis-domain-containing protein [Alternaria alternata]